MFPIVVYVCVVKNLNSNKLSSSPPPPKKKDFYSMISLKIVEEQSYLGAKTIHKWPDNKKTKGNIWY